MNNFMYNKYVFKINFLHKRWLSLMSLTQVTENKKVNKNFILKRKLKNTWFSLEQIELSIFIIPAVLCFLLFNYLPMFGVIVAFKDYTYGGGILGSSWIGFKNFDFFFKSVDAWRITRNTIGYNAIFIVVNIISAVTVALLLYEIKKRSLIKIFQTAMILPRFLSWVIVGYISYIYLNPVSGVINNILVSMGFEAIDWYSDVKYWPFILVFFEIWKSVGMSSVFYYAALIGIDPELYEAAKMDGANKLQQTMKISIPSITPVITILFILAVGNIFRGDFGLFYQIPRNIGLLYPVTDVIDTYIYRGLRQGDVGVPAAVGLFQSFVGMIMIIFTNKIVKKINPENSLF